VPSGAVVCADRTGRGLPAVGGAVFLFKIGAEISLGIMMSELLRGANPFVTKDRGFVEDHIESMPKNHPGVLIIHNGSTSPETITIRIVRRILGIFKQKFLDWHLVELRNSIVELTPDEIRLSHIEGWRMIHDADLSLEAEQLTPSIIEVLSRNASRMLELGS
jgi:hypothetical protein